MKFFLLVGLLFSSAVMALPRVRHVEVEGDQVVTVRTSPGVATIIQVPDRPNSVVVGNMDSFKVEYLDQAITIKPLVRDVKSNLYVYTDWRRFNVELISGSQDQADYVVYLENPSPKKVIGKNQIPIRWKAFSNSLKNDGLSLEVRRVGRLGNTRLVEFQIKGQSKLRFLPEWIWVTQGGQTRPLQNLFLSGVEVGRQSISGLIELNQSDFSGKGPLRLELRRKRTSYLTLPSLDSW